MVLNVTQGEGAEQHKAQRHVEGLLQGCSPRGTPGFPAGPPRVGAGDLGHGHQGAGGRMGIAPGVGG